jgi:very-short-patch-repair endonuclease
LLWKAIKGRKLQGLHFRKQHPVGPYVLDFYCEAARLCVEVDGMAHDMGDNPLRDLRRDSYFLEVGIQTMRIPAEEVLRNLDGVILGIIEACRPQQTPPPPASGGRSPSPPGRN